jgi:hypothetical protein
MSKATILEKAGVTRRDHDMTVCNYGRGSVFNVTVAIIRKCVSVGDDVLVF